MTRVTLLRTLSVAALAAGLAPPPGHATTTPAIINGGGATSPQFDLSGANNPTTNAPRSEFSLFNSTATAVQFGTYWGSGSGAGQKAFIINDLTCDIDGATGANSGSCVGPAGGANTVYYGTSDNPLSAAQISTWATSSFGQSASGNLIQLPSVGTGTAITVNNTAITKNGQLTLSDSDLCGVFSGLITNWSQITDSARTPAAGVITVVYRTDSAAPSFLLTNHLASVCTSANTEAGVTFTGTTTFATLFKGNNSGGVITGGPLASAVGEKLNNGVANYLAGLSNGPITSAIGYLAPDWTSIITTSGETLSNGKRSTVLVAALKGSGTTAYTPTVNNIKTGLLNPGAGATNTTPPTTPLAGANPTLWVPVVPVVTTGYPIVGYGTFDLPQCYANSTIASGVISFLTAHYKTAGYLTIQKNNGLVPLSNTPSSDFVTVILQHITTNATKGGVWNDNIENATACTGKAGR